MEKFSVLMSVYAKDRPAWVHQALESVLSNTVQPSEVVIMVDGPVPEDLRGVLDASARNPLVRVINQSVNMGRGAALSKAVPQCRNELIALVDADDVSRSDRFEKQLATFAAAADLAVVGGQVQEVDAETFRHGAQRCVPLTHADIKQYLKTRMPFNNPTVMFKKTAVLDSGGFQPFGLLEDYYMWARVIAKGYKTANVPDVVVDMRVAPALYSRRGGWGYFKNNYAMSRKLRELGLISWPIHAFNTSIRFCVQVLMPNWLRGKFYRGLLRYKLMKE